VAAQLSSSRAALTLRPAYMSTTDNGAALKILRLCRSNTRFAYIDAGEAAKHLAGARLARAGELAEMLADALAHTERLIMVVEGDLRSEEYS
jgi:hypothetical protein